MTMEAVAGTRRSMKELVDGTIRVQIDIDPPHRAAFLRLFPEIDMAVALAPLVTDNPVSESTTRGDTRGAIAEEAGTGGAGALPVPAKAVPNELARKLHVDGYFRNPKLWAAMEAAGIYTQVEHKKWVEARGCFLRNGLNDTKFCEGDVVLHHCNSAAIPAAGHTTNNPRKPPHWYGVPLCAIVHHQNFVHASNGASREQKQALLLHAVELTAEQMKVHMKRAIGIESLRDLTQAMLDRFEESIGL